MRPKTVWKIFLYILAIAASLLLLLFLLVTGKNTNPGSMIVLFGIWLLFFLFCLYKLLHIRHRQQSFRKGTITVAELDDFDGIAFETLACEILLANGFEAAENTQASCDYGVDVLAKKDGMTYAIQCKRYLEPVGIEAVQQVYAGRAYYECHVAVVFTNQTFTANACKLADKIGVVLWDREMLRSLL